MDTNPGAGSPQAPGQNAIAWVEQWDQTGPLTALREILALSPQVQQAVAQRLQMHPGDLIAMEHLMAEPLGPVELSKRLHLTSAAATVAVDRLQSRGHVVREPDPTDGRRTRVVVTESGRNDVFSELLPMFRALATATDGMTTDERALVTAFLTRATAALKTML